MKNKKNWFLEILVSSAFMLILITFMAGSAIATGIEPASDIIPDDRVMDWIPGVTVGVPGGIPEQNTIFVNVLTTTDPKYKCYPDGVTNSSTALQNAIMDCPAGQVVYIPQGVYRVNSGLGHFAKNNCTIRGDGQGKTILMSYVNSGSATFSFGAGEWPPPKATIPVLDGATKGSTEIELADTSEIVVGRLIRIDPENPSYVHNLNSTDNNPTMGFTFKVTSKTETAVTFTPPLPIDLSSLNPKVAVFPTFLLEGVGIESLTIDLQNAAVYGILLEQAWGCWIKDVEITNSYGRQMFLYGICSSEIRGCFTHNAKGGGPNHEGIDLSNGSCWNLIEDNTVVNGGAPGIILGDAVGLCQGNVIAYNYCSGTNAGGDVAGADISFSHGPHNAFNLLEGNIANMLQSDGYYGSSSHNTIFRNWVKAELGNPANTMWLRAIDLTHLNTFFNVVGNVLGTEGYDGRYEITDNSYGGDIKTLYRLGYPSMGNAGYSGILQPANPPDYTSLLFTLSQCQQLDLNVEATLFRWGNFDYATNTTRWDVSEVPVGYGVPVPENHDLPASLYLTEKPAWWPADLAWPPIGPDLTNMTGKIPAQLRYENTLVQEPEVISVEIEPSPAAVGKGQTQQFMTLVTATGDAPGTVTWSLTGQNSTGTTISADGLLKVGADETADNLTVTATSLFDSSVSGMTEVNVIPGNIILFHGFELENMGNDEEVKLSLSYEQMVDILETISEPEIVFDLINFSSVEISINASVFKNVDKTLSVITKEGRYNIKTKSLYNNSGKSVIITVNNKKLHFKNGI